MDIQTIITEIDRCIRQKSDEAVTLGMLAQKLGYTESYVSRKFREISGMQFREYLRCRRLAFALQELALYLDTHPEDHEALELYRSYQRMYRDAAEKYARTCGPLTHRQAVSDKRYTWMCDPWPWEYAANKEG